MSRDRDILSSKRQEAKKKLDLEKGWGFEVFRLFGIDLHQMLDLKSLSATSQSCWALNAIMMDETAWKRKSVSKWPKMNPEARIPNWRGFYVARHNALKKSKFSVPIEFCPQGYAALPKPLKYGSWRPAEPFSKRGSPLDIKEASEKDFKLDGKVYTWELKCPVSAENLTPTREVGVDFCKVCAKNVYHTSTVEDFVKRVAEKQCVSFEVNPEFHSAREALMSRPGSKKITRGRVARRPD